MPRWKIVECIAATQIMVLTAAGLFSFWLSMTALK
jgi:hypothetical protein